MKLFKSRLITTSLGLIFLGACSNATQTADSISSSPTATTPQIFTTPAQTTHTQSNSTTAGRQVVEVGSYHLEFEAAPESNGTHIDLYLQTGDSHQPIPDANVTAQVQFPDGSQKELPLRYDFEGKHYTALLPGETSGEHRVAILSDIKGQKVNGRFTFNR